MSVSIKTPADIEGIRRVGRMTSEILDYIGPFVQAGRHNRRSLMRCVIASYWTQQGIAANVNYTPPWPYTIPQVDLYLVVNHVVSGGIPGDSRS